MIFKNVSAKNNFKLTKNTLKIKKSNECGIIITFYEFFDV